MRPALLIVGHGTRSAAGAAECAALAGHVRARRPDLLVAVGNLELRPPLISDAVAELVAAGATHLTAVPLVLFAARHAKHDIPAALADEQARRPGVRIRAGAPLGVNPRLVDIVDERLRACVSPDDAERTAVVLVRAGSTDPAAGPDVARVARLLGERGPYPLVTSAFAGIASPRVDGALAECRRQGYRQLAVVPYLLFTGELAARVERLAAGFAAVHPEVTVTTTAHLGADQRIAELVLERYQQVRIRARQHSPRPQVAAVSG